MSLKDVGKKIKKDTWRDDLGYIAERISDFIVWYGWIFLVVIIMGVLFWQLGLFNHSTSKFDFTGNPIYITHEYVIYENPTHYIVHDYRNHTTKLKKFQPYVIDVSKPIEFYIVTEDEVKSDALDNPCHVWSDEANMFMDICDYDEHSRIIGVSVDVNVGEAQ